MNWDQVEGGWKQLMGQAKQKWGKFTDDDWTSLSGKKDEIVGKIQQRYGTAKDDAEREADEWSRTLADHPEVRR